MQGVIVLGIDRGFGGSFCSVFVEVFKVDSNDRFSVRRSVGRFLVCCCECCKQGDLLGRQTLLHIICTKFGRATDVKSGLFVVGVHRKEKSVGAVSMSKSGKLSCSVLSWLFIEHLLYARC